MTQPIVLLVCGGRDYADADYIRRFLSALNALRPIGKIIHGAARGADTLAGEIAEEMGIEVEEYPADWTRDGKAAGPIRNQVMLDTGRPDAVLALPGGRGTADMVNRATKSNLLAVFDLHNFKETDHA